jgi:hypothetical protein
MTCFILFNYFQYYNFIIVYVCLPGGGIISNISVQSHTSEASLNSIQFGAIDFGFDPPQEKINFVTDFVDQVLRHNGQNWDDEAGFMDHPAIRGKWIGDVQERFSRMGNFRKFEQKTKQKR